MAIHHRIGTAGWSVPRSAEQFPANGSSLERYAAVFPAVEINSSFYRRHRLATWQRWHDAVPQAFRFSVKLPQTITHEPALAGAEAALALFFEDVAPLGAKLGAVLISYRPSWPSSRAWPRIFWPRFDRGVQCPPTSSRVTLAGPILQLA